MQLQTFGIEIRKIGDVNSLYKEVDSVLRANEIGKEISPIVAMQTVAHALHKMLKVESFFSICIIENCAKVCQICIPKERMQVYSAIHCVNWNEMLPDYRQLVIAMILDDFRCVFIK